MLDSRSQFPTILPPGDLVAPGQKGAPGFFGLPAYLLSKARARLKLFALVVFVIVFIASTVVYFMQIGAEPPHAWLLRAVQIEILVFTLVLYLAARSKSLGHATVLKLGLAFEILQSLASSVGETWFIFATYGAWLSSTWIPILIVSYPLIIPSPPRITAAVAFISAAMAPLGLGILAAVLGEPIGLEQYIGACIYPGAAAVIATIGSRVIHRINVGLAQAQQMGSYQLDSRIGAGGMGEVWKASHRMLARPAAIKLIKPRILADVDEEKAARIIECFKREAQATATLESSHTIDLYDFGIADDGSFYYVMELLDGIDLQTLVDSYGPVPVERVVHFLLQVGYSLRDAHKNDLVHRDIKPANLIVCPDRAGDHDFVKVLDFGLVALRPEGGSGSDTKPADGVVRGTPAYLAPEMATGQPVDERTDIYALGCVAFWLLTGRTVFGGETPMEVARSHVNQAPQAPSSVSELKIPSDLDELVLACLEKDPGRRPQGADAFIDALKDCPVDRAWTRERAQQWWHTHRPATDGES